jgi:hypothetical protein
MRIMKIIQIISAVALVAGIVAFNMYERTTWNDPPVIARTYKDNCMDSLATAWGCRREEISTYTSSPDVPVDYVNAGEKNK